MNGKNRKRRSLIWVNVLVEGKLKKAIDSEADCIVMDLEDTLPIAQKAEGREAVVEALQQVDFRGKERIVRINSLDTPYAMADLAAVLPARPDSIRLPKCETADQVKRVDAIITSFEQENGLTPGDIGLILMIETPKGVFNARELASSSSRVWAIGIGLEDLTTEMGINRRYELGCNQMLFAKQMVVMAAKEAGIQALDSSTLINDPEFIYKDCRDSRDMGFDGRSMVNVDHVAAIKRGYMPSEEEIYWANGVIETYRRTKTLDTEPYYGTLFVDIPVVKKAENILAKI